jgi:hypothetical protein
MSTTTNITTSYSGEKAQGYLAAALLSGNTIENGGITVKPNVKKSEVLKKIATGDLIADGTCDFTATSSVTLTERILTPKEFQVNLELCKTPFRADWDAISMGYSAFDTLPPDFASFLVAHVAENVDVVGTSINSGNVIDELGKVVDAIPAALYGSADLKIYVAQNVYRAYVRALGGFASNGQGANGVGGNGTNQSLGDVMFDGVPVFVANGLASNYIVAAESSNLFFGTGLLSDSTNEVKVLDMADLDGSQNVRVIMRFTATVNYAYGSEIVLYTPA